MRKNLLPVVLLFCLLFSCASGAKRFKYDWLPFFTAGAAGTGTEIIRISPYEPNTVRFTIPRPLLGYLFAPGKTLYAFTSGPAGTLHCEIITPDGSRSSNHVPLPFSATGLSPSASAWTAGGNLAVTFSGDSGISLLILDPAGTLLDRQMLPDFLLGPQTDYKLGKTALSACRITRIDPAENDVLVLSGTAELFEGQPQNWKVRYRMGKEVFLESRVFP